MPDQKILVRDPRYMDDKADGSTWRKEIDAGGCVVEEVQVKMNDKRVVTIVGRHLRGKAEHHHSKKSLYQEVVVPTSVYSESLKCFYDAKKGSIILTGKRKPPKRRASISPSIDSSHGAKCHRDAVGQIPSNERKTFMQKKASPGAHADHKPPPTPNRSPIFRSPQLSPAVKFQAKEPHHGAR